jgi:hypothetical protein
MTEIVVVFAAVVSASNNLVNALEKTEKPSSQIMRTAVVAQAKAKSELLRVQAEKDKAKGIVRHASMSQHVNRHAPLVQVIGWEDREDGVCEYVVETSFGCGPEGSKPTGGPILTKHRYV